MSNYTEAIFVAPLVRRRRLTPFWFWIFSTTAYVRPQFSPHFFDILAQICPRCLLCVFVAIYVESCAISVERWRLLVSKYLVQEERFSTKLRVRGTSSKWRQMTLYAENTRMYNVWSSMCEGENKFLLPDWGVFAIISNSGLSSSSLLLVYLVNSPKKRL